MSVVLGELNCSMSEYNNMTWAEFQIRLFAFRRIEKKKDYMLRELMYNNTKAPHLDPKKIPKSINKFMPLDTVVNKGMSEMQKQAIIKAQLEYNNIAK